MKYPITQADKVVGYLEISDEMADEIAEVAGETGCAMALHPVVVCAENARLRAMAGVSVFDLKGFTIKGFSLAWQPSSPAPAPPTASSGKTSQPRQA